MAYCAKQMPLHSHLLEQSYQMYEDLTADWWEMRSEGQGSDFTLWMTCEYEMVSGKVIHYQFHTECSLWFMAGKWPPGGKYKM
jgi:hypothetical protein